MATPSLTTAKAATVGNYLLNRLQDYGIDHIFGIPGDYVLRFDKLIEEHPIELINTTRENTAGYMADAYARLRGMGCACITYGVGINIANALAQAYVESSPVVLISGAASSDEYAKHDQLHHLINKSIKKSGDLTQLNIFSQVTLDQVVLRNPETAPCEIDRMLHQCFTHKKPVYIELPRDLVDAPIPVDYKPQEYPIRKSDPDALQEALEEAAAVLEKSDHPFCWIGHELHRFGLIEPFLHFAERYEIPICTSLLGKTAINERHPLFTGVYQGAVSRPELSDFVDSCDCLILLGSMLDDVSTGFYTAALKQEQKIIATHDMITINHHQYPDVLFRDFIRGLAELPLKKAFRLDTPTLPEVQRFVPQKRKTTTARLFECIQSYLGPEHLVFSDTGDCLFGSSELILNDSSYISCAYFCTLGFCVPGAIGAAIANPSKHVIGIVGDGAFQMTGMELTTAVRYGLDPLIIVMNNHGYGMERPLIEGSFNDIVDWRYSEVPHLLGGGDGYRVVDEASLNSTLEKTMHTRGKMTLIEVELDKVDFSPSLQRFFKAIKNS